MTTMFRGVFLTSHNVELTAKFYRDTTELPFEAVGIDSGYKYWQVDDGRVQIAIHDADAFADYSHPALAGSNLTHLYFKIDDQPLFLRHLQRLNITPYSTDEVVVTVVDPDGRKVMFGTA